MIGNTSATGTPALTQRAVRDALDRADGSRRELQASVDRLRQRGSAMEPGHLQNAEAHLDAAEREYGKMLVEWRKIKSMVDSLRAEIAAKRAALEKATSAHAQGDRIRAAIAALQSELAQWEKAEASAAIPFVRDVENREAEIAALEQRLAELVG